MSKDKFHGYVPPKPPPHLNHITGPKPNYNSPVPLELYYTNELSIRDLDCLTIHQIVTKLYTLGNETSVVDVNIGDYEVYDSTFSVSEHRKETPEEVEERLSYQKYAKEYAKVCQKENKKKTEEEELKLYEKLKKKYGEKV